MKQFNPLVIVAICCAAYAAFDVQTNTRSTQPAVTWQEDRDDSGKPLPSEPFIVQIQDVPDIAPAIFDDACTCNCDGKCMEAIQDLKAEVAALKEKCENCQGCTQPPRPLQSSVAETVGGSVTLNGRSIDPDAYITQHRGYDAPHWSIHNHENIANVHSHLRDHGLRGFEGLPKSKLMALHQAVHHAGEAMAIRSTQAPTTVTRLPQSYSSSGCANGRCNQPRSRLLFRRR